MYVYDWAMKDLMEFEMYANLLPVCEMQDICNDFNMGEVNVQNIKNLDK